MSQHRSLRAVGTTGAKRNVLKRFERAALLKKRDAPADTRLVCLVLDDPRSVALGSEPVRVGGEIGGRVTSGGYGYSVGKSIAYAFVPSRFEVGTPVEVEVFGDWVSGQIAAEPLYDPEGVRVRG